jgi:hypothetical protein
MSRRQSYVRALKAAVFLTIYVPTLPGGVEKNSAAGTVHFVAFVINNPLLALVGTTAPTNYRSEWFP